MVSRIPAAIILAVFIAFGCVSHEGTTGMHQPHEGPLEVHQEAAWSESQAPSDPLDAAMVNATIEKDAEALRTLLSEGANPDVRHDFFRWTMQNDQTSLMHAAVFGETEIIAILLDAEADVNAEDSKGWTSLTYAVYYNKTEAAELLLSRGAHTEVRSASNMTPLMLAAMKEYHDMVEALIAHGADLDAEGSYGSAMDIALLSFIAGFTRNKVVMILAEYGAEPNPDRYLEGERATKGYMLMAYAEAGNVSAMQELVALGADVNYMTMAARTPLIHATRGGSLEAVEWLLDMGADINATDETNSTALHYAVHNLDQKNEYAEIVALLLERGIDASKRTRYTGKTAKEIASDTGHAGTADLIRQYEGR